MLNINILFLQEEHYFFLLTLLQLLRHPRNHDLNKLGSYTSWGWFHTNFSFFAKWFLRRFLKSANKFLIITALLWRRPKTHEQSLRLFIVNLSVNLRSLFQSISSLWSTLAHFYTQSAFGQKVYINL